MDETWSLFWQVLGMVDPIHKALTAEQLRLLDKRMALGIHKISWSAAKPALDYFFKEARR